MESKNEAAVSQEEGNADWRTGTRSQVYVEYLIILNTSSLIRLSHLYQEFCLHFIVFMNDGGIGWMGVVDL